MKTDAEDRENLKQAAHVFGEFLYRHTSLSRPNRFSLRKAWENGWYKTVANPRPNLSIDIFLDCFLDEKARGFWVGFSSEHENEIRTLVRDSHEPIGADLNDDHSAPPSDLTLPIMESWEGDDSYFGIYFEPGAALDISRALHFVCNVLRNLRDFANSILLDEVGLDVYAIEGDRSLDPTTKQRLINVRIGQGAYRQEVEKLWDGKCSVLSVNNREVLRASHVKPWKLSNNQERLDPHNGLLLAAHLDALFDAHLITFSNSGEMVIAPDLSEPDRELLHLGTSPRREPSPKLEVYLSQHRAVFDAQHGQK